MKTPLLENEEWERAFLRIAISAILVIVAAGFYVMGLRFTRLEQQMERMEHVYTVKPGDTLWAIAEENCGDTYVLQYLEELKDRNPELRERHGQLRPGDVLVVMGDRHESLE